VQNKKFVQSSSWKNAGKKGDLGVERKETLERNGEQVKEDCVHIFFICGLFMDDGNKPHYITSNNRLVDT
jgi:hypothetical protein